MLKNKWIINEKTARFLSLNLLVNLSEKIDTGTPNKRTTGIAYILVKAIRPGTSFMELPSISIKQKPIMGADIITVKINDNIFRVNT